jgi:phosphosulfolactate phosphohydrolase-like enzyme
MVDRLDRALGAGADLSDAARTALAFFRSAQAPQVLLECRVGRMMARRGLAHEVEFACRIDSLPVVPVMREGSLRCA